MTRTSQHLETLGPHLENETQMLDTTAPSLGMCLALKEAIILTQVPKLLKKCRRRLDFSMGWPSQQVMCWARCNLSQCIYGGAVNVLALEKHSQWEELRNSTPRTPNTEIQKCSFCSAMWLPHLKSSWWVSWVSRHHPYSMVLLLYVSWF